MKNAKEILDLSIAQAALLNEDIFRIAEVLSIRYAGCCGRALQADDLYNEALVGAAYAAKQFNPSAGVLFKTFAEPQMKNYVLRVIKLHGCIFRLSKDDREQLRILSVEAQLVGHQTSSADDPEDDRGDLTVADCFAEEPSAEITEAQWQQLLSPLSQKERTVVELVHGLTDAPLTMKEAAKQMGVSHERARQIYNRAITKLQLINDNDNENDNKF